eukprot:7476245-Lingulodinium_polyedra.AAC.1
MSQIVVPVFGGRENCLNAKTCMGDVIVREDLTIGGHRPFVVLEKSDEEKREFILLGQIKDRLAELVQGRDNIEG